MPVGYAIPGYGYVKNNANLAGLGTAATPSQAAAATYIGTAIGRNASLVNLPNGSLAEVAFVNVTTAAGQKIIVDAALAADVNGQGTVHLDIQVNGASVLSAPVDQSFNSADGDGVTSSFFTVLTLSAGTHRISVYGGYNPSSDGATSSIATNHGAVLTQVVAA